MRFAAMIFILFGAASAHALGPIPNGTYTGKIQCLGKAVQDRTMIVDDTSMSWGEQKRVFTADSDGFFTIRSVGGLEGSGHGYFTPYGLHFDYAFMVGGAGGRKILSDDWEGTYYYSGGTLYFFSSRTGPKEKMKCSGSFVPQH